MDRDIEHGYERGAILADIDQAKERDLLFIAFVASAADLAKLGTQWSPFQ
jgi:hypothetical protein